MTRTSFGAVSVSVALALSLGLSACGPKETKEQPRTTDAQTAETTNAEATVAPKAADARQVIGVQVDAAHEVALRNNLEAAVIALRLRAPGAEDFSDNLIPEGGRIATGEEVRLLYVPFEGNPAVTIQTTLEGSDELLEFTDVPLSVLGSVALMWSDGVPYVNYVDEVGKSGSTKEVALARATSTAVEDSSPVAALPAEEDSSPVAASPAAETPVEEVPDQGYEEPAYIESTVVEDPADVPMEAPSDVSQSTGAYMGNVPLRN